MDLETFFLSISQQHRTFSISVPAMAQAPDNMNQNQGKLPLPLFSAEGSSVSTISMEAELFLTRFEDWATVCAYTNVLKAKALGYALSVKGQLASSGSMVRKSRTRRKPSQYTPVWQQV